MLCGRAEELIADRNAELTLEAIMPRALPINDYGESFKRFPFFRYITAGWESSQLEASHSFEQLSALELVLFHYHAWLE